MEEKSTLLDNEETDERAVTGAIVGEEAQRGQGLVPADDLFMRKLRDGAVMLPRQMAESNQALILNRNDEGHITIGMVTPNNEIRVNDLMRHLKVARLSLKVEKITEEQFSFFRDEAYGSDRNENTINEARNGGERDWSSVVGASSHLADGSNSVAVEEDDADTRDNASEVSEPKDVRDHALRILREAYRERASDIHIVPGPIKGSVWFRVDGLLKPKYGNIPLSVQGNIVRALTNMCKPLVPSHRINKEPYDSTLRLKVRRSEDQSEVRTEYRVAFIPAKRGAKVTLRLNVDVITNIEQLGFDPDQQAEILQAIEKPEGMVLITGPTGSGKSNTLISLLEFIGADRTRSVLEMGNPIEFESDLRVQVNITETNTWMQAMRSALRSDPDIICPGEFRDQEEAKVVVEAAITGHLVPTTFHTNDIASTFTRLQKMGISSYLQSEAINLIISQRLIRKLCTYCRQKDDVMSAGLGFTVYKAKNSGCNFCSRGYRGRTAVGEVLRITPEVREWIGERTTNGLSLSGREIIRRAKEHLDFVDMQQAAGRKLAAGITSYVEVERVMKLTILDREPRRTWHHTPAQPHEAGFNSNFDEADAIEAEYVISDSAEGAEREWDFK